MWIGYPFLPSKAIFLVIYLNFEPINLLKIQYFLEMLLDFYKSKHFH